MSGETLGRTIKDHKELQDAVMIMLTPHTQLVNDCQESGFVTAQSKPVKWSSLQLLLSRLWRLHVDGVRVITTALSSHSHSFSEPP